MQQNAQAVFDWASNNGIKLNVKKTKVMIFGSAQNLAMLLVNLSQIIISGSLIPYVEQVKNLRLLMTQTLKLATANHNYHQQSIPMHLSAA